MRAERGAGASRGGEGGGRREGGEEKGRRGEGERRGRGGGREGRGLEGRKGLGWGVGRERSREASTVGGGQAGGGLSLREAHCLQECPRGGLGAAAGTRPVAPVGAVGPRVTGPRLPPSARTVRPVPPRRTFCRETAPKPGRSSAGSLGSAFLDVSLRGRRGPGVGGFWGPGGRGGPGDRRQCLP